MENPIIEIIHATQTNRGDAKLEKIARVVALMCVDQANVDTLDEAIEKLGIPIEEDALKDDKKAGVAAWITTRLDKP